MSVSNQEKPTDSVDQADVVAVTRQFLETLPKDASTTAAISEGREIAAIVDLLGLSPKLIAAVRIYPLVRDRALDIKLLNNSGLNDLSQIISDLVQLGRFTLPADWQPGEALAVEQSEALRKMLLAIVADARLVLIRVAEQLYRLRRAKKSPRQEQKALAIETREIYAALANRLGVGQLKWELEDLSLRYLDPETYKSIAKSLKEKRVEREAYIEDVISLL